MISQILECPHCGSEVELPASAAGQPARCGVCRRGFQAPRDVLAGPALLPVVAWRRTRTGLTWMLLGGLGQLGVAVGCAALIAAALLLAPHEVQAALDISAGEPSDEFVLLSVAVFGAMAAVMLAGAIVTIGCLVALQAPAAAARTWLGWSLASQFIGGLLFCAACVILAYLAVQLEAEGEMSEAPASLLTLCLTGSAVLTFLAFFSHGGFLRRLACAAGCETAARSAAAYQLFFWFGLPLAALGLLVLVSLAAETVALPLFAIGILLISAVLLCWWLQLIQSVRHGIKLGLWNPA